MILAIIVSLLFNPQQSIKNAVPEPELTAGHATAYCLPGTMANGETVHDGACAVNDKTMLGKTLIIYQRLPNGHSGEVIGYYVICDTGCKQGVVDVWCEDLEECQEFMNKVYEDNCKGNIYYQVIEEAEG